VPKLQTCLTDGWVIYDRRETSGVGPDGAVEECLVVVEQIDQINVAFEVRAFVAELHHHSAQLEVFGLGHIGYQANDAKGLLFTLGKGC
jgi:hypothetical protein